MIQRFSGDYRFLSNFAPCRLEVDGKVYKTLEHAYQAMKTETPELKEWIRNSPTPNIARVRGRTIDIRANWGQIKLTVMLELLRKKFAVDPFREQLVSTFPSQLIEGNRHGDVFWGRCYGKGENHLGRLLMQVRDELRSI
jgi:ribA/ribD-fused uncharacterized protein